MKKIDFLPSKYREQQKVGRQQLWRTVVLVLFGAAVGGAAFAQHWFRRAAENEVAAIDPEYTKAVKTNQVLTALHEQLQHARSTAELFAYLQHPWPRTQILAELVRATGPQITLKSIRLKQDIISSPLKRTPRARRDRERRENVRNLPSQRDVDQLRSEVDEMPTAVELAGVTTDTTALHSYVSVLAYSRLFNKAELTSLESIESGPLAGASHFKIRLVVRPGYGQPGGPTIAPNTPHDKGV